MMIRLGFVHGSNREAREPKLEGHQKREAFPERVILRHAPF